VLVGLTVLLYLPYFQHYVAGYRSVEMWNGSRTPVRIYLWIYGIMLFPLLTRMLIEVCRAGAQMRRRAILRSRLIIGHWSLVVGGSCG